MNEGRKIKIYGKVTIWNGDEIIVNEADNAIVRQGMRHLMSFLTATQSFFSVRNSSSSWMRYWNFGTYQINILFGKRVALPTTQLMDDLTTKISINPNSITNNLGNHNTGSGSILTKFVATWTAGALGGQLATDEYLGELGLYLNCVDRMDVVDNRTPYLDYTATGAPRTLTEPLCMFSRFDLGFARFKPNPIAPVVVEWELGWVFV